MRKKCHLHFLNKYYIFFTPIWRHQWSVKHLLVCSKIDFKIKKWEISSQSKIIVYSLVVSIQSERNLQTHKDGDIFQICFIWINRFKGALNRFVGAMALKIKSKTRGYRNGYFGVPHKLRRLNGLGLEFQKI